MRYDTFVRIMRAHVEKIDGLNLLTSSEKDQRKQAFRLLAIDCKEAFGVSESQIIGDCNLA